MSFHFYIFTEVGLVLEESLFVLLFFVTDVNGVFQFFRVEDINETILPPDIEEGKFLVIQASVSIYRKHAQDDAASSSTYFLLLKLVCQDFIIDSALIIMLHKFNWFLRARSIICSRKYLIKKTQTFFNSNLLSQLVHSK